MKWADVDFHWKSLTIRDKVEGERTIPMTPYVARLLRNLKAINDTRPPLRRLRAQARTHPDAPQWKPPHGCFHRHRPAAAPTELLTHKRACASAGLDNITLHGLRCSFGFLAEGTETPAGVVAQIMGHKPSATAAKHYRVRPLDLLRMWHTKIEGWVLEQAGIEQPPEEAGAELRLAEGR